MLPMFYTIATYCHFNIKQMISVFSVFIFARTQIYKAFLTPKASPPYFFLLTILIMIYNNLLFNKNKKARVILLLHIVRLRVSGIKDTEKTEAKYLCYEKYINNIKL